MGVHYYYDSLDKEKQRAYYAIKEGFLNLKESFNKRTVNESEHSYEWGLAVLKKYANINEITRLSGEA